MSWMPWRSEVRFPLDPLWASSAIDAIGIDYYPPLSDWRDTPDHADRAQADAIYERAYLEGNLNGGEGFDFYYADQAAREAQTRTPITDGLGKPWMFRQKDLWSFSGAAASRACRRRGAWFADGVGPAIEADLADRDRMPGGRQGCEPAECISGSEIGERRLSAFLQWPA